MPMPSRPASSSASSPRRVAWRQQREAGEVALDALMPIEPGLEERWKYWVPQPMPDDSIETAPDSVRGPQAPRPGLRVRALPS